ncbi:hypothetical protein ACFV6F_32585 [Kitasatospora phosalacinea]|uniref:hypothetical protein n=1 Tax=Kitasatospora phosalacinea TaxID=2065 RepID=UPI00364E033C
MNTTSTLDLILFGGEPSDDGPDYDGLNGPIAEAAAAGVRAAAWIRTLAARQDEEDNQQSLERYARAVERVLSREIVLDRDSPLEGELLYELDPVHFTLQRAGTGAVDLRLAERIALAAIGAVTASAPGAVLGDLATDLPRVCRIIGHALAVGAAPDRGV